MARRKNRWVLAKVHFTDHQRDITERSRVLTREAFETELLHVSNQLFGTIGGGFVVDATNVVVTNAVESIVLFQTRRSFLPKLLCIIRCLDSLHKIPVTLEVFHVGGTLQKCRKLLFTTLLETLSQLQTLRLTGTQQHNQISKTTLSAVADIYRIKNPTDL